ncbi:PTS system mannose/fructose/sorbose family transporter subunit IID [Abiotrophia defectiva]
MHGRSRGFIPTCHCRTNTIRRDPEAYRCLLMRHSVFYNTEPQTGQLVNGIVASLEEEIGMGKDIDENVPVTVKASLMGPLARIGDSIMQGIIVEEICLLPLSP